MKALRLVLYAYNFDRLMRALANFPDVRAVGADDFRQVLTVHLRDGTRLGDQLVNIGLHGRDHATHHAVIAQVAHESTRVDIGKDRDLELFEILLGNLLRAPVRTDPRKLAHDEALNVRTGGFVVVAVGAVVSDLRVG